MEFFDFCPLTIVELPRNLPFASLIIENLGQSRPLLTTRDLGATSGVGRTPSSNSV